MSPRQQRCAVAAAIVAAHAMAALLLCYGRQLLPLVSGQPADARLLYVIAFPAAPLPHPAPGALHGSPAAAAAGRPPAPAAPSAAPAILAPREQAHIDWDLEAEVAADDRVAELPRAARRRCDDSDKPGSWLPRCRKHRSSFEWNAEPQRAGFENGLPYVRLGKRCVLILGLVGCALGAAPAANRHLFDELKDPDRDRSSVPDIAALNEPVSTASRHPSVVADPVRADSFRRGAGR